jgi:hypothetical protein
MSDLQIEFVGAPGTNQCIARSFVERVHATGLRCEEVRGEDAGRGPFRRSVAAAVRLFGDDEPLALARTLRGLTDGGAEERLGGILLAASDLADRLEAHAAGGLRLAVVAVGGGVDVALLALHRRTAATCDAVESIVLVGDPLPTAALSALPAHLRRPGILFLRRWPISARSSGTDSTALWRPAPLRAAAWDVGHAAGELLDLVLDAHRAGWARLAA